MIDEKKLIDDLIHNDGMEFEVKIEDYTPEALANAFQEFINKMKEGFIDLINAQPSFGWISTEERLPEQDGHYLCNFRFGYHSDMTFTRVLDYYATDAVPHFQHTLGDTTMKVTHWMPLPQPPKGGEH